MLLNPCTLYYIQKNATPITLQSVPLQRGHDNMRQDTVTLRYIPNGFAAIKKLILTIKMPVINCNVKTPRYHKVIIFSKRSVDYTGSQMTCILDPLVYSYARRRYMV